MVLLGDIDQNTGNVTYTPAPGFKGNDKFTFKATDSQGADSNIATVSITVVPPPTTEVISPPKATETFPVNGSTNMPTTTDKLTATFDQEIDTSSAKISLKDGAGNEIPVDVAPEGSTVTITPKSVLNAGTNYTVSIDQITGKGKTNVGSTIFNFTTSPVVEGPQLVNSTPRDTATEVSTTINKIEVSFNEKVDIGSCDNFVKGREWNRNRCCFKSSESNVTITPKSDLKSRDSL